MSEESTRSFRQGPAATAEESFFAPVKGSLAGIVILSLVGAASSVVPFLAIVELARALLPGLSGAAIDAGRVWTIVVVAVAALFVSFGAAFLSGLVSHFADAELQLSLRQRIIRQLQRLPLGWFDRRSSGTVRKLVENDVVALHQLVGHTIQDVLTAIAVPVISLIYLFAVQWQLALAALAPLVVTMIVYPFMMRGGAEKYRQYDEATNALSGATVEFVHGIAVVKRFGQLGRSHRRYRDATKEYVHFVGEWTRETAVAFTIVELVTSPVVVLTWLLAAGAWLVTSGAAEPIDVLPGLLLGLGLTGPLMKLGASGQFLRNATKAQRSLAAFFALSPVAQPADPTAPRGHGVDRLPGSVVQLRRRAPGAARDRRYLRAGHGHCAGRRVRLGEVDPGEARPAVLRRGRRGSGDRWCRRPRDRLGPAVSRGRIRVPGHPAAPGEPARQHPAHPA